MISDLITLLEAQSFTSGNRIYSEEAPPTAAMPYVVIELTNTEYNKTLDSTGGLIFADLLVVCVSNTLSAAETLADAVSTFIDDYTGSMGSKTCEAVLLNDREINYEPSTSGTSGGRYSVILDLQLQYS